VAYRMIAERNDQKVVKERASALIVLANARVWESEGWQVMITDADGAEFDPAGFEKLLGPGYTWSPQEPLSLSPQHQAMELMPDDPTQEETNSVEAARADDIALETETLEAEGLKEDSLEEPAEATEHDQGFEALEETDEYGNFEPYDEEELEEELEPHH
jgi:hypothetical protein